MEATTQNKSKLRHHFGPFSGIDAYEVHGGKESIADIKNFRIMPDGSLKKREGYKVLCTDSESIRAIWAGKINSENVLFYADNSSVKKYSFDENLSYDISELPSNGKDAQFFYYRDGLYLADGNSILRLGNDGFSSAEGYVPLLGKDWATGYPGEIYEPLNILTSKARITYKVSDDYTSFLPTLYPVKTIDALYKNGVLLSESQYYFDDALNTINVSGLTPGDALEANLEFVNTDFSLSDALGSCTSATVFGGINNSRVFIWNGEQKNTVFTSTYVSRKSLEEAQSRYGNCSPLYFQSGNEFTVGDSRYDVTAVTRHYDRLLIHTEKDTWMADSSACGLEEFPVMNINSSVGCAALNATAMAGNDPISVGDSGIFRWTSETDQLDECNAYSISTAIDGLLPDYPYGKVAAHTYKKRGEVWISFPEKSVIWIYSYLRKCWYKFTDIKAYHLFEQNENPGFTTEFDICLFSENLYLDYTKENMSSPRTISASFESGFLNFGTERSKRLNDVICSADLEFGEMTLTFTTDRREKIETHFDAYDDEDGHRDFYSRLFSHRFHHLKVSLSVNGYQRQVIHSLEIGAR